MALLLRNCPLFAHSIYYVHLNYRLGVGGWGWGGGGGGGRSVGADFDLDDQ